VAYVCYIQYVYKLELWELIFSGIVVVVGTLKINLNYSSFKNSTSHLRHLIVNNTEIQYLETIFNQIACLLFCLVL